MGNKLKIILPAVIILFILVALGWGLWMWEDHQQLKDPNLLPKLIKSGYTMETIRGDGSVVMIKKNKDGMVKRNVVRNLGGIDPATLKANVKGASDGSSNSAGATGATPVKGCCVMPCGAAVTPTRTSQPSAIPTVTSTTTATPTAKPTTTVTSTATMAPQHVITIHHKKPKKEGKIRSFFRGLLGVRPSRRDRHSIWHSTKTKSYVVGDRKVTCNVKCSSQKLKNLKKWQHRLAPPTEVKKTIIRHKVVKSPVTCHPVIKGKTVKLNKNGDARKVYHHAYHDLRGNENHVKVHTHRTEHPHCTVYRVSVKRHFIKPSSMNHQHQRSHMHIPSHIAHQNMHFFDGIKDIKPLGMRFYHGRSYLCWGNVKQEIAFDPKYYSPHRHVLIETPKDKKGRKIPVTKGTPVVFCVRTRRTSHSHTRN